MAPTVFQCRLGDSPQAQNRSKLTNNMNPHSPELSVQFSVDAFPAVAERLRAAASAAPWAGRVLGLELTRAEPEETRRQVNRNATDRSVLGSCACGFLFLSEPYKASNQPGNCRN